MYTKQTFELHMRHITFLLCNAGETEAREGFGSTEYVTLLAEKSLWHNGFLTLENEVIQRYHSSQAALIALQKKPLFLCCKGMSKCNVLGEKTVGAQ